MRSKIFICLLFLSNCNVSSQRLFVKEYTVDGQNEKQYLSEIYEGEKTKVSCLLSNIWKFDNNKFYYLLDKSVFILNKECQKIDSLTFDERVIDLSVKGNLAVVSITDDEVEYYASRIFIIYLDNKSIKELPIEPQGVKFSLNISDDGLFLSYIHQDVTNSSQNLVVYSFSNGLTMQIDEANLKDISFGEINFPTKSYWVKNDLYYATYSNDYESKYIFKYNLTTSRKTKIKQLSREHGLVFRVSMDESCIILLKRYNHKFDRIISLNITDNKEEILYITDNTLSDLDDFAYIEN